jgi:DNA-directed RNA polymerase subunit H (RpoH/RPB5)
MAEVLKLVIQTQEEMMADRGFKDYKQEEVKGSDDFYRIYTKGKEKVFVYYITSPNPLLKADFESFNEAVGYVSKSKSHDVYKNIILIYPDQKSLTNISSYLDGYHLNPDFQSFSYKRLTYNPTKRMDAPTVRLIPEEDEEALLKEMGLNKKQLLIVSSKDPIVQYYGWKSGRIVEFERYLELECVAPYTLSYRRIV